MSNLCDFCSERIVVTVGCGQNLPPANELVTHQPHVPLPRPKEAQCNDGHNLLATYALHKKSGASNSGNLLYTLELHSKYQTHTNTVRPTQITLTPANIEHTRSRHFQLPSNQQSQKTHPVAKEQLQSDRGCE
ncbi:uncharacterized protein PADG_00959 [Paracoccidioides brasiliensis Pb18]|uniref:Uncharacterized protein n=1 Tax=Paracoccidioides brasiliensis (strain Pb18) TaxID=502780 RepID=C1FYT3_PARBD|nr:uncharacterized protein PADG_00959 [Paracoccidioides brasiliensis Pb18]EEH44670.2 hypothetical protein PADG_00959 [Paracoccidioides brasiliensis Pb18]